MTPRSLSLSWLPLVGCLALTTLIACEGPAGADGVDGMDGTVGTDGVDGEDGGDGVRGSDCWDLDEDGEADLDTEDTNGDGVVDIMDCRADDTGDEFPQWVGSEACAECHDDQYQKFIRSGHPYKLVETGGVQPVPVWETEFTGDFGHYAPEPPEGFEWSDISHVIGGWGWKQRFIDNDGYIITGDAVQFNLIDDSWTSYNSSYEVGTYEYTCGTCHTSGYRAEGNQNDMPGMVGTWEAGGVHCEECHGEGSFHVEDPYDEHMHIDRTAEQCGTCHYRTSGDVIPASSGYGKHHQQWNEMYHSRKHSMDCIDCHDPHSSAHWSDEDYNPDQSIGAYCVDCHFNEAANQKSATMEAFASCEDCHMPYATKSALAANTYVGDVRTHLFGINTDADAEQFNDAGDDMNSYITLDFACKSCHSEEGDWNVYTDEELEEMAVGYHDRY